MTKDQKESLNRVRAQAEDGRYNSKDTGTYSTQDIQNVLTVYHSVLETLEVVEGDIQGVLDITADFKTDSNIAAAVLRGTLDFIKEECEHNPIT